MLQPIHQLSSRALQAVQRRLAPQGDIRPAVLLISVVLFFAMAGLLGVRLWLLSPVAPGGQSVSPIYQSAQNIVDNLCASILVAIILGVVVVVVSPPIVVKEDIAILLPANINPALRRPLADTKDYWWRGRSGRFFRSTVLPALDVAARHSQTARRIYVLAPNPNDDDTLTRYARYRNSANARGGKNWTQSSIRVEILATILSVLKAASNNVYLQPAISLEAGFALFRADLSDQYLVLTREEATWPGYISSSGTKFYDSYKEELRLQMDWGDQIQVPERMPPGNWSLAETRQVLANLGQLANIRLSDQEYEQIQSAIDTPADPYGG